MSDELERRKPALQGEVLPPAGAGDSGITVSIGQAWALDAHLQSVWDSLDETLKAFANELHHWCRTAPWD